MRGNDLPVEYPVSSGGVVIRRSPQGVEVLICSQMKTPPLWGLPKGTPKPGENLEETARREVTEETGLKVEIKKTIGSIRYWFVKGGVKYHKTVHFFLMAPTGGAIEDHDPEYDVVQWFPASQALRTLTYKNEVEIVEKAVALFEDEGAAGTKGPP